jgi:hypothetical protein
VAQHGGAVAVLQGGRRYDMVGGLGERLKGLPVQADGAWQLLLLSS